MKKQACSAATIVRIILLLSLLCIAGCASKTEKQGLPNTTIRGEAVDPYENLMHECELINGEQMLEALERKSRLQSFNGAVCRWDVSGGGEPLEVTFYWFETGSLDREKETLDFLSYESEWHDFDGQEGIVAHPSDTQSICGTVAKSQTQGIVGWWVQPIRESHVDYCEKAMKLMMKSLNTRI